MSSLVPSPSHRTRRAQDLFIYGGQQPTVTDCVPNDEGLPNVLVLNYYGEQFILGGTDPDGETAESGVVSERSDFTEGALALDADGDGDVDLVVVNYGGFYTRHEGGALSLRRDRSRAVVTLDADGDGGLDLYIVNDGAPNELFLSAPNDADLFRKVSGGDATAGAGVYNPWQVPNYPTYSCRTAPMPVPLRWRLGGGGRSGRDWVHINPRTLCNKLCLEVGQVRDGSPNFCIAQAQYNGQGFEGSSSSFMFFCIDWIQAPALGLTRGTIIRNTPSIW
eukprot:189985-Prorocentrum_minimum.AAC.2